jgi:hypothetical protein
MTSIRRRWRPLIVKMLGLVCPQQMIDHDRLIPTMGGNVDANPTRATVPDIPNRMKIGPVWNVKTVGESAIRLIGVCTDAKCAE